MYRDDEANRFLEVTYQNGDKEILYYKDFSSGAMIENIVRRAKKLAIKRVIAGGAKGVSHARTCSPRSSRSTRSTRTCPTPPTPTTGRRSRGKKGERIVFIRTLVNGRRAEADRDDGGRAIERVATGQYL